MHVTALTKTNQRSVSVKVSYSMMSSLSFGKMMYMYMSYPDAIEIAEFNSLSIHTLTPAVNLWNLEESEEVVENLNFTSFYSTYFAAMCYI